MHWSLALNTDRKPAVGQFVQTKALGDYFVRDILSMFNFVSNAVAWIKDDAFKYRWANHAFLLTFSCADESEIIGKTDYDFVPVYLADLYQADDSRVLKGETIVARVEPVSTYHRLPCWSQTWKVPLRDAQGKIFATFGLSRPLPDTDSPEFPFPGLARVLVYLREHCHQNITNRDLADLAGLSVRALERKFKRHMQLTPTQFLGRLRVTLAAADLCHTSYSIVSIASRHGFSDQSHLTRLFRKHFGTTPKAYRKAHRGNTAVDP